MKKYILINLVCLIALTSCEQSLEVELPGQESRLVMNALLEPSDTLKVFLTKSKGVLEGSGFNEQFDLVKDANVYLKNEEGRIFPMGFIDRSRLSEPNAFYYLSGHEFMGEQSYELVVEKENFPIISSIQKLPKRIQIKSLDMVNMGQSERFENEDEYEVTLQFDDPAEVNFYEISGSMLGSGTFISDGDTSAFEYRTELFPYPVNPAYQTDYSRRNVFLFNDILLNQTSEMVFRIYVRRDMDLEVTIRLSHVSEAYFRFYETANLQQYNRGDFLSQPVLVYNNVTNGLGIFKARNSDQKVFEMMAKD